MNKQFSPFEEIKQKPFERTHSFIERLMDITGLNRFFLREGKRPFILTDDKIIVSPIHGAVSEVQTLSSSNSIRGKTHYGITEWYTFEQLVHEEDDKEIYQDGLCFNLYLAPWNLHYVLFPTHLTIKKMTYHPAFCRPIMFMKSGEIQNERVNIRAETENGTPIIFILIGSFMVSGIECVVKTGESYRKGDLLGGFKLGSTVMLLFPKGTVDPQVKPNQKLIFGEPLAKFIE